jgi:hypothetical protein
MYLKNTSGQALWRQSTLHAPAARQTVAERLPLDTCNRGPFFDAMRLPVEGKELDPAPLTASKRPKPPGTHVEPCLRGMLLACFGFAKLALRFLGPSKIASLFAILRHFAAVFGRLVSFWVSPASASGSNFFPMLCRQRLSKASLPIQFGHIWRKLPGMRESNLSPAFDCMGLTFAAFADIEALSAAGFDLGDQCNFQQAPLIVVNDRRDMAKLKGCLAVFVPRGLKNLITVNAASKFMAMLPDSLRSTLRMADIKPLRDTIANQVKPRSFHRKTISARTAIYATGRAICI